MLDGKVVAITGAGGGLGRAHALLFAEHGAKVVVNDLGTSLHGEGEGEDLADRVVAEIEEAGGEAVANKASVADPDGAESIVEDALEAFGRLDIVVNNAGILRDKTIVKMTDEQWESVLSVHLDGTFYVTRAAVRHFEEAGHGGRIINTTSLAGLKGNFGQANYGAAKAGIAGLTRVVALEGKNFGVTCNAVAPVAKTRMTDDIDAVPDEFAPEEVSPLVAWLGSDEAEGVTGRIFGAHGTHYFEYVTETTPGVEIDGAWEPAQVGERFDEITEMPEPEGAGADAETAQQVAQLFEALPGTLKADKAAGWTATIQFDVEGVGSHTVATVDGEASYQQGAADDPDGTVTFDSAETLLKMAAGQLNPEKAFMSGKVEADNMKVLMSFGKYFDLEAAAEAVEGGVEAEESAAQAGEGLNEEMVGEVWRGSARFVEQDEIVAYAEATENDNPAHKPNGELIAPPLYPVRIFHPLMEEVLTDERLNLDLLKMVHGEQDMRFHQPLRPKDLVAPRAEITEIREVSSGELVTIHFRLMRRGEPVVEADTVLFVKSGGGGGSSKSASDDTEEAHEILHEADQPVADDQPDRYAEASGDHNPIHLDEQVAQSAGLPGVILHGLCTMAFAGNAVVDGVCGGEVGRLERLKVRFSKPVFPGQTVTTRIWEESTDEQRAVYGLEALNDEGERVLEQGVAEVAGE